MLKLSLLRIVHSSFQLVYDIFTIKMNHATGQQMVFLYLSGGDMEVIGWEFFNSKFTVISHSCKNHITFYRHLKKCTNMTQKP